MRTHRTTTLLAITAVLNSTLLAGQSKPLDDSILRQTFDFTVARSPQPQRFDMETVVLTYAPDGKRVNTDVLKLQLKCMPARATGKDADEYTCIRFAVKFGNAPEVTVPAITDWTYSYKVTATGMDEKGQVFGIDHAKFEKLLDSNGQPLPVDKAYYVYNAFIDFHGFCNVFAEPTTGGKGIQDLKRIGDKIVHAAAFRPTVFDHGDLITLVFDNGIRMVFTLCTSLVDIRTHKSGHALDLWLAQYPASVFNRVTPHVKHHTAAGEIHIPEPGHMWTWMLLRLFGKERFANRAFVNQCFGTNVFRRKQ